MAEENKKKEMKLQEKFIEFQVMQQQLGQVQQQLQQLNMQKDEVDKVRQNIKEIKDVSQGSEMLIPICSGIFAKAKLEKSEELFVNVGNNVVVQKSMPDVSKMLEKQGSEIMKMEGQLTGHLEMLAGKAKDIEKELEALIKGAKEDV